MEADEQSTSTGTVGLVRRGAGKMRNVFHTCAGDSLATNKSCYRDSPVKPLTRLSLLLCFLATTAGADIHRCTIDGRTTYRDRPCPAAEVQSEAGQTTDPVAGCYEVDAPGWENGRNIFRIRIIARGAGSYAMTDLNPAKPEVLLMRRATPAELHQVKEKMHFEASDGVVMQVPKDTPNMPALPLGLYKGTDEYRDTAYFFFGFLANGKARRIVCK